MLCWTNMTETNANHKAMKNCGNHVSHGSDSTVNKVAKHVYLRRIRQDRLGRDMSENDLFKRYL